MAGSTHRTAPPGPMVWHGWGDPRHRTGLSDGLRARLAEALGTLPEARPPVEWHRLQLPPSRLTTAQADALRETAAEVNVDDLSRLQRGAGRSYPDLVHLRSGRVGSLPDAVVSPSEHEQVLDLLRVCGTHRIAVVPIGGGTSVVGGVDADPGPLDAVVALDLRHMDQLLDLDEVSGIATFQPGIRGADAEVALRSHGASLGHYPQSYEYATLGGFVATRSAGQASTGRGRIDDRVVSLRAATPVGTLDVGHPTPTAAGPDLRALLVGSEGAFGVLTELRLHVHAAPEVERYEVVATPTFASGAATVRALVRAGAAPDVVRLSDRLESRVLLGEVSGWQARALHRYLQWRSVPEPTLLLLGWEGSEEDVPRRRALAHHVLSTRHAVSLGRAPGDAWARGRFDGPYLRDDLLDAGILVETLETSSSWAGLGTLYLAVRAAIAGALASRGTPGLVLCHLSHAYPTGASLYFTWLARQEWGAELEQWQAVKQAAGDAIVAHGGTITHHHAIGRDHLAWMQAEVGALGLEVLRAIKDRLDPEGILNPGKLLPDR
jgi:alkyldihydroxyacetonephosphate synthase